MFEQLNMILDFDPTLIAAFAGFTMLVVQMLKGMSVYIAEHPLTATFGVAVFLGTMVAFNVAVVLEITLISFLVMSAASGVYSASKSKTTVELADYSDEA